MRDIEYKVLAKMINMVSLKESIFMTLFQSFGLPPFALHFAISLFQFAWSCLTNEQVTLPFGRGRKSLCSKGRLLPILKTLFIHWKKRSDRKLTFFSFSPEETFSYICFVMILELQKKYIYYMSYLDVESVYTLRFSTFRIQQWMYCINVKEQFHMLFMINTLISSRQGLTPNVPSTQCSWRHTYLTIIGRGWARYRDMSVASWPIIDRRDTEKSRYIYIDYFMVGERVRFLFTSCEESQTNERVFERVSLRFFTTSE